jgi:hypothetical protein
MVSAGKERKGIVSKSAKNKTSSQCIGVHQHSQNRATEGHGSKRGAEELTAVLVVCSRKGGRAN